MTLFVYISHGKRANAVDCVLLLLLLLNNNNNNNNVRRQILLQGGRINVLGSAAVWKQRIFFLN